MTDASCPFCDPTEEHVFYRGNLVAGLWDNFPVSPGHALLVPVRHVATWFEATAEEQVEMVTAISKARDAILSTHSPDGFNIGVNVGEAGGQTVPHLHLHLIPRYQGDVEDPRGGVRWVVPTRATYWEAE
jgi:diadenosine tetraphosphate (Ap4A) HIT family hydrolase